MNGEKNEHAFVGKHYLMKQAFGQDELHRREAVCTREDPPQCSFHCPLHLDMRLVCEYAAKGNFAKAAGVIRSTTPFLHLLAKNCSGACTRHCVLAESGDGIQCRALERACALYGGSGAPGRFMIPKKKQRVRVYGDDLFALDCCWELGKKGYEIIWHTARTSMQEVLYDWHLTEEEAKAELTAFSGLRITLERCEVKEQKERKEADAVCVSPALLWDCEEEGIFTEHPQNQEAEWILSKAHHTALAADRYIQGVGEKPDTEETLTKSRLFVTMDGVTPSKLLADPDHVTKESAQAEAARCIQCACLECIKGCVYLQHYKRNPKAAIREIYNNMSIVMGNHMANGMINACDLCGQCKAACPNDFDYPDVCRIARHTMVETEKMPPSTHEFALLDQQFSNGEAFLSRPQPGFDLCKYLFFPGCQAAAVSPDTVEAAYQDLCARLDGGVGLVLGCCGAISEWAAREEPLQEAMEKLHRAWSQMGEPTIICACPTCKSILDRHTGYKTAGIWEILMQIGVQPVTDRIAGIQDACGARGDRKMQEDIRTFVKALGCTIRELPQSYDLSPCCGYGGLTKYANPEVAAKKAAFAANRGNGTILTYCMACRDQLLRAGADTCHILELAYKTEPKAVPDLSMRRWNRLKLKQKLLSELWKEEFEMETMLPVNYAEGVEVLMDERMILKSDVDAVLRAYEESEEAVYDQENQWFVASLRLGNVTFWVKFRKEEDGYMVYGAYSHRMTVE